MEDKAYSAKVLVNPVASTETQTDVFVRAGTLEELKSKGRLLVHGPHRPILVIEEQDRVYALDNRCPHMGFPLDRGSVEDGILTCHWHHARFDLASGCTFDLWADDVPTCPVEVRDGEVWVGVEFDHPEPAAYWRQRLHEGMAHNLGLVIAKALQGQLSAGVGPLDIVRQAAVFGARNRDGWGTGMTILTALGNLLAILPKEETYLALLHGVSRIAADCDGAAPRRQRSALASRPDPPRSSGGYGVGRPSVIARQPSEQHLPPSRWTLGRRPWQTCSSRPRPIASLPIADTRSTSSTKHSSALTSSVGNTLPMCCPRSSAKWSRRVVRMNQRSGASPQTS
jgi:nitrite reductase/ring-hydroxylating ferredoxin subunit